jgi:hypothetical protein
MAQSVVCLGDYSLCIWVEGSMDVNQVLFLGIFFSVSFSLLLLGSHIFPISLSALPQLLGALYLFLFELLLK